MKRFFRLSAALAALALLSGCAALLHPRLVEDLQLIQTIGFDGGIGDMTVSVSSGEASEDAVSAQLAARGASIQTAVQRLQDFSPREELFFAHIRYAAVGEDCARGGITPILDYFERGTQTQLSVPLFVVKGESAYTLIAANGGENEITAALSSLEADTERQGSAHCFTVLEIASRLNRSGAALACAIAPTAPERSVPEAEDGATLALEAGYAVFRGETLCGLSRYRRRGSARDLPSRLCAAGKLRPPRRERRHGDGAAAHGKGFPLPRSETAARPPSGSRCASVPG